MVRVGYFKLKFYKCTGSGHSKVHSVNEIGTRAEKVLDNEKVKRSTYLPASISLMNRKCSCHLYMPATWYAFNKCLMSK